MNTDDIEIIIGLYEESYPDNFFDKRMLETGKYFGYFENGKLIGIAGIHVYSAKYKVATLGNITIDPSQRGKANVLSAGHRIRFLKPAIEPLAVIMGDQEAAGIVRSSGWKPLKLRSDLITRTSCRPSVRKFSR